MFDRWFRHERSRQRSRSQQAPPIRSRSSSFILESLESRVLLAAAPAAVVTAGVQAAAPVTVPHGNLPDLDVDLNGTADALTDGLVMVRYLFGFSGAALTNGVVDPAGQRTDPTTIAAYLDSIRSALDADKNGAPDALTDGLLIVRNLFGFTGTALTDGVVDPAGGRTDPAAVTMFLDNMNPARETVPPMVGTGLQHDTGFSTTDTITGDPTITGSIADLNAIASFTVGLDASPADTFDMLANLQPTGVFTLSAADLNTMSGGTLSQGAHALHLRVADLSHNVSALDVSFTLDTIAPAITVLDIDPLSETIPLDAQTALQPVVALKGAAEPFSRLVLSNGALVWQATADANGAFEIPGVSLAEGQNSFSLLATDNAGNVSQLSRSLERVDALTGLNFPGSAAVPDGQTMRFSFDHPELNGLPLYGPDGQGVTYIWRVYVRPQAGYYTTFFWGNDNGSGDLSSWWWNDGSTDSYYGAHPYPDNPPDGTTHQWEIAVEGDDIVNGAVEYDRWYTQALRVWADADGVKHHEFYWDLSNIDADHMVAQNSDSTWGNAVPPDAVLTWGDAPWNAGKEVMDGIIRGIQIYAANLSLPDIQSEIAAPLSTQAGANALWYLNLNPTPNDISDKSGKNHNPAWVGDERPALFVEIANQPPIAGNDEYTVLPDTPLSVTGAGVLGNDTDPDGATMSAILTHNPSHGTVALAGTGGFTYVPDTGFVGLDSFAYQASDGVLFSSSATVTLAVGVPTNQVPAITSGAGASTLTVDMNENTTLVTTIAATDPNNDPVVYSLAGGVDRSQFTIEPASGMLSFLLPPNFEHPTDLDANNSYFVVVQVSDQLGGIDLQTVKVQVKNVNEAPVVQNDAYTVPGDGSLTVDAPGLLTNDADPDAGALLTAQLAAAPLNGSVMLNTDGGFLYTPNAGFVGIDAFSYQAFDGVLLSAAATVTLSVQPPAFNASKVDPAVAPLVLPSEVVDQAGGPGMGLSMPAQLLAGLDPSWSHHLLDMIDGRGTTAVIIDTGVDVDHPFFGPDANHDGVADRIVYQWDFADNDADASDRNGHGSHIASIIGSQDATYPGLAPEANLIALKVFKDSGAGNFSYVEQALQWVVSHVADYHIDVVNMSLGDGQNWTVPGVHYGIGDELATLANEGVLVIAAAGNNFFTARSQPGVSYPAADPNVIGVGAVWTADFGGPWQWSSGAVDFTTGTDRIASFSQRDPLMTEVFAPGARLVGANQFGGTTTMQGTSQAAAYLSGTALLAQEAAEKELGRKLTPEEFVSLAQRTGTHIVDGDDEQDNVVNTGLTFARIEVPQLLDGVEDMRREEHGLPGHRPDWASAVAVCQIREGHHPSWVREFLRERGGEWEEDWFAYMRHGHGDWDGDANAGPFLAGIS